jgi:hypothetical protein
MDGNNKLLLIVYRQNSAAKDTVRVAAKLPLYPQKVTQPYKILLIANFFCK